MRNYYNKNTLISTNNYIKQVSIFADSKIKNYLCFSILHEQTTAKARCKLVG